MLPKSPKAQYSMEFIIFFALLSILFSIWLIVYANLNQEAFLERDEKAITDLGNAIQAHIFVAANAHTGYYSTDLEIPSEIGPIKYDIINTPYVFEITTKNAEYTFHIPYTLGTLQKGENMLWNVGGVVAIGKYPPIVRENGDVNWTECADQQDNEGDGLLSLIDESDGGCYRGYENPQFDQTLDSEQALTPPGAQREDVYNFHVLCKNAQEQGVCHLLDDELLGFDARDCCLNTFEDFCATDYHESCEDGCSCPS